MSVSASPAFVSYSHADGDFALRLATDLKAAGALVWIDRLDIPPGVSWDNAIENALLAAPEMLLILSPDSVKSENVRDEISFALDRRKVVIPVLYLECEVPLRLLRKQWIDFRADYAQGLHALLTHMRNTGHDIVLPTLREAEQGIQASAPPQPAASGISAPNRTPGPDAVPSAEPAQAPLLIPAEAKARAVKKLLVETHTPPNPDAAAVPAASSSPAARSPQETERPASPNAPVAGSQPGFALGPWLASHKLLVAAPACLLLLFGLFLLLHGNKSPGKTERQGCNAGDAAACDALGRMYTSAPPPVTAAEAVDLFRKACDGGSADGCGDLGDMYKSGTGAAADPAQAAQAYEKACDAKHVDRCDQATALYDGGQGLPADHAKAAVLARKACDANDALGCLNLGIFYDNGRGVTQDYTQSASLFQRACDAKILTGCSYLGFSYDAGHGVTQDSAKAVELYRTACDGGVPMACTNIGVAYEHGTGVAQDPAQAFAFYGKACDLNEPTGCNNLGIAFQKGIGTARDARSAATAFRKACDSGKKEACMSANVLGILTGG